MEPDKNDNNYPPGYSSEATSIANIVAYYKSAPEWCRVHPSSYLEVHQFESNFDFFGAKDIMPYVIARRNEKNVSDEDYEMVFVWDIEEITQLSRGYIEELKIIFPDMDSASLSKLVERILVGANFCSSEELFEGNIGNIEDVVNDGTERMSRLTPKYDELEKMYKEISNRMRESDAIINQELIEKCGIDEYATHLNLTAALHQEVFQRRWYWVKRSLKLVNDKAVELNKKFANVVLSEDGIGYAAAQMLVSSSSKEVDFENIFSSHMRQGIPIFERLQKKFGEKCVFIYVTSKNETSHIDEKLKIHVWPVVSEWAIQSLYCVQRNYFLV